MGLLDTPTEVVSGVLDPISSVIQQPFGRDNIHPRAKQKLNTKPDFPDGFRFIEIVDGKEQTRTAGSKPGQVQLNGNMMPMVPFQFGGTQKIAKEYYPGNAEPSVQVLGARENDLTIHGRFKDKRFDNPSSAPIAIEYQKQCDAVRLRGNLLRISMGEWERYGFLEEATFKLTTKREIEYELRFFIVGFHKPRNCKIIDDQRLAPFSINTDLIKTMALFNSTYSAIPASLPKSLADIMNSAISDVAAIVAVVTNFVDTVLKSVEDAIASANRAIGLIKNARSAISKYKRRIGAIAFDFTSIGTQLKGAVQGIGTASTSPFNLGGYLKNASPSALQLATATVNQHYIASQMSAISDIEVMLAKMQRQFSAISKTVPLARYLVRQGDTLQQIATKFYNDPSSWQKIFDHNKLTSTVLAAGSVLEIPKL